MNIPLNSKLFKGFSVSSDNIFSTEKLYHHQS